MVYLVWFYFCFYFYLFLVDTRMFARRFLLPWAFICHRQTKLNYWKYHENIIWHKIERVKSALHTLD